MSSRPELANCLGKLVTVSGLGEGFLRYYGPHKGGKEGMRAGVEMKEAIGKNNGTVGGDVYFTCAEKFGALVDPAKIGIPGAANQPTSDAAVIKKKKKKSMNKSKKVYKTPASYTITVVTADDKNAGTDSSISIVLSGELGESRVKLNDQNKISKYMNKFEKGQTDIFKVDMEHLGVLKSIKVTSDGAKGMKLSHPEWHLQEIHVVDSTSNKSFEFECDEWFQKGVLEHSFPEKEEKPKPEPEPEVNKLDMAALSFDNEKTEEVKAVPEVGKLNVANFAPQEAQVTAKREVVVGKLGARKSLVQDAVGDVKEDKGPQAKPGTAAMKEANEKFAMTQKALDAEKAQQILARKTDINNEVSGVTKVNYVESVKPQVMSPKRFELGKAKELEKEVTAEANAAREKADRERRKQRQLAQEKEKEANRLAEEVAAAERLAEGREAERIRLAALCTHSDLEAKIGHSGAKLKKTGLNTMARGKKSHPMLAASLMSMPIFIDDE